MGHSFKYRIVFILFAASALLLTSCGGDSQATNEAGEVSSSNSLKQEVVNEASVKAHYIAMAGAVYADAYQAGVNLQQAIDAFLAAPSVAGQDAMKKAYKALRIPYQQSEIMRWDSDITLMKKLDADGGPMSVDAWEGQVNAWPLDESFIDSIIAGDQEITRALLLEQNGANANEANVSTGIHAVEYLIWGADIHGTGPGAGVRPFSDYLTGDACTNEHCARRATYLKVAVDLLVDDLKTMRGEWTAEAVNTEGTLAHNMQQTDDFLGYVLTAIG